ncbi:hypothetical protein MUU48_21245 [Scandinavium sp. H11S7]|nr:hypothetical protein [Scandinavium hiltneri]
MPIILLHLMALIVKNDIYDNEIELAWELKGIDNDRLGLELVDVIEYSHISTDASIKIIYWFEPINVKDIDAKFSDLLKIT